ncbi:hypothetical protein EHV08_08965 [Prevotella koreensis]|uniref:Uncharacterized protein n=1 Tax=Prevotella koreensis TaxID=2490854 RepID=A0A3S0S0E2_9BACT|nr:hypothetical protein EHV08_08965 [Prevotella koreensis]
MWKNQGSWNSFHAKLIPNSRINIMLAAAAYNFKRAMRVLLCLIKIICEKLKGSNFSQEYAFAKGNE